MQKVIIVTLKPYSNIAVNLEELNTHLADGWKVINTTPISQQVSAGDKDYQLSGATVFSYVIEKEK